MGNFAAKIGYRSPFKKYDKLELNLEWPISSLRNRYYQAGLDWTNPFRGGSSSLHFTSSNESIYKGIDNQWSAFGWGFLRGSNRVDIDISHRKPSINDDAYKFMQQ